MIPPSIIAVAGESIISLYPSLLKTVQASLWMRTFIRFFTFPVIAIMLGSFSAFKEAWSSSVLSSIAEGLVNIIHVISSFISHEKLQIGTSTSIFYTHPIFILLWAMISSRKFYMSYIIISLIAFYGAYLIATSHLSEDDEHDRNNKNDRTDIMIGIISAFISAITETIIYVLVKEAKNPFLNMYRLYPPGLLLLIIYGAFNINEIKSDFQHEKIGKLLLFNIAIAFVGYMLRFVSITLVSPFVFSFLSFVGIVASFMWGIIINKEIPTKKGVVGSLLIIVSVIISRLIT